jgi:PPE-SVP subfamily C-terminal region
VTSTVPTALQSLATSSASTSGLWDFLDSNFVNGVVSGGYLNPVNDRGGHPGFDGRRQRRGTRFTAGDDGIATMGSGEGNDSWLPLVTPSPPITPFSSTTVPLGSTGIPGAELTGTSAGTNQAAFVGRLAVPQSWTAAAQVENHAGAAFAGGGWSSTPLPESPTAVPGMPGVPAVSTAGRHFGTGPRYGFHVTVPPRPPAAG